MTSPTPTDLLSRAREATENARAPYSEYTVGAAVATPGGVSVGCNLEVANYSDSLHAEAVALGTALADGAETIEAVAVTTSSRDGATPCGSCRQLLSEYCDPETPVYCDAGGTAATGNATPSSSATAEADGTEADDETSDATAEPAGIPYDEYTVGELLPAAFDLEE